MLNVLDRPLTYSNVRTNATGSNNNNNSDATPLGQGESPKQQEQVQEEGDSRNSLQQQRSALLRLSEQRNNGNTEDENDSAVASASTLSFLPQDIDDEVLVNVPVDRSISNSSSKSDGSPMLGGRGEEIVPAIVEDDEESTNGQLYYYHQHDENRGLVATNDLEKEQILSNAMSSSLASELHRNLLVEKKGENDLLDTPENPFLLMSTCDKVVEYAKQGDDSLMASMSCCAGAGETEDEEEKELINIHSNMNDNEQEGPKWVDEIPAAEKIRANAYALLHKVDEPRRNNNSSVRSSGGSIRQADEDQQNDPIPMLAASTATYIGHNRNTRTFAVSNVCMALVVALLLLTGTVWFHLCGATILKELPLLNKLSETAVVDSPLSPQDIVRMGLAGDADDNDDAHHDLNHHRCPRQEEYHRCAHYCQCNCVSTTSSMGNKEEVRDQQPGGQVHDESVQGAVQIPFWEEEEDVFVEVDDETVHREILSDPVSINEDEEGQKSNGEASLDIVLMDDQQYIPSDHAPLQEQKDVAGIEGIPFWEISLDQEDISLQEPVLFEADDDNGFVWIPFWGVSSDQMFYRPRLPDDGLSIGEEEEEIRFEWIPFWEVSLDQKKDQEDLSDNAPTNQSASVFFLEEAQQHLLSESAIMLPVSSIMYDDRFLSANNLLDFLSLQYVALYLAVGTAVLIIVVQRRFCNGSPSPPPPPPPPQSPVSAGCGSCTWLKTDAMVQPSLPWTTPQQSFNSNATTLCPQECRYPTTLTTFDSLLEFHRTFRPRGTGRMTPELKQQQLQQQQLQQQDVVSPKTNHNNGNDGAVSGYLYYPENYCKLTMEELKLLMKGLDPFGGAHHQYPDCWSDSPLLLSSSSSSSASKASRVSIVYRSYERVLGTLTKPQIMQLWKLKGVQEEGIQKTTKKTKRELIQLALWAGFR